MMQAFGALRTTPRAETAGLFGEVKEWKIRSGSRASDYGLSDERNISVSDDLKSVAAACAH